VATAFDFSVYTSEFVFDGAGNAYIRCFYITMKTAISVGMNVKPVGQQLSWHPISIR
jgi:hypothetical protein